MGFMPSGPRRLLIKIQAFVKRYREGGFFASQSWMARQFGVTVRTIQRWVAWLVKAGWLRVTRRGQTSATYHLLSVGKPVEGVEGGSFFASDDVASNVASDVGSEYLNPITDSEVPLRGEQTQREPHPQAPPRNSQPTTVSVVSVEREFQSYIGVALAAGKPINHIDVAQARRHWQELDPASQDSAREHYQDLCFATDNPRYIPLPQYHLKSQAWTRTAPQRLLPSKLDRIAAIAESIVNGTVFA